MGINVIFGRAAVERYNFTSQSFIFTDSYYEKPIFNISFTIANHTYVAAKTGYFGKISPVFR